MTKSSKHVKPTSGRVRNMTESQVKQLVQRFTLAHMERANFSSHWQQIAEVLSPAGAVFTELATTQGTKNSSHIYDTTGTHSNELLSSGFFSLLTSPTVPWFTLLTNDNVLNNIREVQLWLSDVSRTMAHEIQRPQTGFTTAMHEFYLEYGAYGNGTMFVTEKTDMSSLLFMSLPLSECYYVENNEGFVDTLIRRYNRTAYQLVERFGEVNVSDAVRKAVDSNNLEKKFEVLHFIMPNFMAQLTGIFNEDLPYISIYMEKEKMHVLSVSGFNEQPFMAARFYKMPQETYGRGPGSSALPDLNMLQEMTKTILRGAQKIVDPPLQMPDQGFLTPPTTAPGNVNYYRTGSQDRIEPLQTGGRPDIGIDVLQMIQNRVREIFFVDQLQLNIGPQMTATEVLQRTEEKQRLMGPVIGRASTELLSPLLIRCFGLLSRAGRLPEPPAVLFESNAKLKILYTSPIFKAQEQVAANNIMRAQQVLMPFMSADPTIGDFFHPTRTAEVISEMFNLDPRIKRTDEEITEVQMQRQQQQMAAMNAEQLKNTGIGLNNLAAAGETMGDMSGVM